LCCTLVFHSFDVWTKVPKQAGTVERVAKIEVTPSPFPPESLIKVMVTFRQKPTEAPNAHASIQLRAYEIAETDGEPSGDIQSKAAYSAAVPAIPGDGSEVTITFTDFKLPTIAPDKSLYLKVWYVFQPPRLGLRYSPIGSAKFHCETRGQPAASVGCVFVPKVELLGTVGVVAGTTEIQTSRL
jgi:hypothetical protein